MSQENRKSTSLPSVCVIGAGMAGLTAAKALKARGIPYTQFEISDRVGGLWVKGNKNGRSPAYDSLHLNSSKFGTAFSDFPMPDDYPTYPSHRQVAAYFQAYADRFDLMTNIQFNSEVEQCEQRADGAWSVRVKGQERPQVFDALVVANGHHWAPHQPSPVPPGGFSGRTMHSHDYHSPKEFAGKKVVVVGIGNSALDIACDLKGHAQSVYLSSRRGVYVAPKFIAGHPVDQILPRLLKIPGARHILHRDQLDWIFTKLIDLTVGSMEKYGLQKPNQKLFQSHISVHSYIFGALMEGEVKPKPGMKQFLGDRVEFVDGTSEEIDTIIYCTGYEVKFPFLAPALNPKSDESGLPLFFNVMRPDVANLGFVGLIDAQASIHPLSEMQANWFADYLVGKYARPSVEEMQKHCDDITAYRTQTWVKAQQHRVEWHYFEYVRQLRDEIARGEKRARQQGNPQPIAALVPQHA